MVAYSFQRRFVHPIREGSKRQTIRAERKRHARVGEQLQLYCGMRTRACFLIARAHCTGVDTIRLDFVCDKVLVGGESFDTAEKLTAFAIGDGFENWAQLRAFWFASHPLTQRIGAWSGLVIRWKETEERNELQ